MVEIVDIINSVGFPIAMVIYFVYRDNKMMEILNKYDESIKENIDVQRKNSLILDKICNVLGIDPEMVTSERGE